MILFPGFFGIFLFYSSYCLINKCYRKKSVDSKRCLTKDVTEVW